ncbi:anthranilate phosphoribosyltransferase [Methanophagales archaeon]|nr:MAG: anthranilate phosphoribosyltransferase [Methanophagales archaeon]
MNRIKKEDFGSMITELMRGRNLTRSDACEMFRQVLTNEQPELHQGAFLAAMTAKGATPEEIAGIWKAIYEYDTMKVSPVVSSPLVENCGTGMDTLNTFNISTAASIVAAANGICMAKHGARAITSRCGAVDILEAIGVDVECEVEIVKRSIEKAGIGIFNGMNPKIHPQLARILSQIRFGTFLNIAASLANPALPRYAVRGVYSKDLVESAAMAMREMGYHRAFVVHGMNEDGTEGMDEMSTIGETIVAELHEDGEITTYTVTPEKFGIPRTDARALLPAAEKKEEVLYFLKILSGIGQGPKTDIVCLNAAPLLYLMGKARDLKEGVEIARKTLESGKALLKLREWTREQNSDAEQGKNKLECLLREMDAN